MFVGVIILIVIFVLFCIGSTRNKSKIMAQNAERLTKIAALPEHVKERMWNEEQFNKLSRDERRTILRQKALELYGDEALKWSHEDVRALTYNKLFQ
jgi:hypothetical protein